MLVQKHIAEDMFADMQHDHVFRIIGSAERSGNHMMILAVFFFRIRRVFFIFLYDSVVDFLIVHFLISFHPFRGRNYLLQKAKEKNRRRRRISRKRNRKRTIFVCLRRRNLFTPAGKGEALRGYSESFDLMISKSSAGLSTSRPHDVEPGRGGDQVKILNRIASIYVAARAPVCVAFVHVSSVANENLIPSRENRTSQSRLSRS